MELMGSLFPIARRQTRALLYYLATQSQPIARNQISFLFWPDSPNSVARRHLTKLLNQIKSFLPRKEAVVLVEDSIGLDPTHVWSDARVFHRLCSKQDSNRSIRDLQMAVNLYQKPFLLGFELPGSSEFEEWISYERQQFEQKYLSALSILAQQMMVTREYKRALHYASAYLAVDNLAEECHRMLIEIYGVLGDRSAVHRQFEECRRVLHTELGILPLTETLTAYERALKSRENV